MYNRDLAVMKGVVYQWHPQVGGGWYQYTGTPGMHDTPEKRTDESLWSLHLSHSAMLGNAHTYQYNHKIIIIIFKSFINCN